ncbi:MAG: hypothetical protein QF755_00890 [Candidatus Peribacteraceae bacterium]|nr:hypothetical protein [Candidatus Peribacteraceae bacterium]HCI03427.1 hypothetical protein [Candidatus Peribacteria bacterium]
MIECNFNGEGSTVVDYVANGDQDPDVLVSEGENIVKGETALEGERVKVDRLVQITDELRDLYREHVPSRYHQELGI